ncbi:hypothetical protein, partial [Escherichia coli]|uniref:hypothetical protein n=1 Tax=Escherichia coli TaxID=562 RepID=UPI001C58C0F5
LLLQEFDLQIVDKKGTENGVADHLSRLKVEETVPLDDALPDEHVYAIGICVREHPVQTGALVLSEGAPAPEAFCAAVSKEVIPSFPW